MRASELIDKKAIRTKHTTYCNGNSDRSHMDSPILILKATDSHIVYKYPKENFMSQILKDDNDKPRILPLEFCDDNWIDYDELIDLTR